jgi:hypothetical protein
MVKLDLERIGIPYETPDGIADFHAAGRHSHVTGLLRNGATLVEAKELARHADVRMTMKYTHIGLEDQAAALAGLPLPKPSATADRSEMGRDSGGASRRELSAAGTAADPGESPENEKTPAGAGVSSFPVSASQELAVDVRSGGGGNCTRTSPDAIGLAPCVYEDCWVGLSDGYREDVALRELVGKWRRLTPSVRDAIMELVRSA